MAKKLWKPGQSGNPAGRPTTRGEMVLYAREKTVEALQVIYEVMSDKQVPPPVRLAAANSLIDRGWGKPAQSITFPDEISEMSDEEVLAEVQATLADERNPKPVT